MDSIGLNTFNQLAPQVATKSRADATPERAPADKAASFGAVMAARGAKPGPKVNGRNQKSEDHFTEDDVATDDMSVGEKTSDAANAARVFNHLNAIAKAEPPVVIKTQELTSETEDAWGDFLTKMNDELGISPEDVLKGFEALSDEDLVAKPEDSIDQMVAALGLSAQPAALAKQYFKELIARTEQATPAAEPRPVAPTSPGDLHQSIERALERMDAHLMMNSPSVRASSVPDARTATLPTAPASDDQKVEAPASDQAMTDKLMAEMTPVNDEKVEPNVDRLVRELMDRRPEPKVEAAAPAPAEALAQAAPVMPPLANVATAAAVNTPKFDLESEAEVSAPVAAPAVESASSASVKSAAADLVFASARRNDDEAADSDTDSDDFAEDLNAGLESRLTNGTTGSTKSDFATTLGTKAAPTGPAGPAIAPEIIDNARVILNNGGGEMRVTMNAEGLGDVAMKVNVRDGKVSVEMLTENQDVKRLLEHQLDELKTQLIANNLQVDKLHVDTGSNLARQNDQGQQDAQRQAAREQSWSQQFNQPNGGQSQNQARRQAYDAPAARGYGGSVNGGRGGIDADAAPDARPKLAPPEPGGLR